jgi:hypothetical protein
LFSAQSRECFGQGECPCVSCREFGPGHALSVRIGTGPGNLDLASALEIQPFEETATFRGFENWSGFRKMGALDVPTNFFMKKLAFEARKAWETTYSNE